ncbi:MAG: ABC transporter ATP-binding protein [Sporichthyaceae bacterium]|nr:ABC transporter ATP-binding protein [Sporichthyaceae bacterium]
MSRSQAALPGSVSATHIWKRYRPDSRRSVVQETLSAIRRRQRRRARWVLRDVELEVQPGEAVALIGLNGSGKSTLLKVLAGVTHPNAGQLDIGGRIGALIEVRSGIHPDLSGRENALFYGTVLGLSRRQVMDRFDDIVDFAELSGAIDRQVKFYSSGMQMRLGFSIAAFLEPDILLVDEALAVGDVGFQQRCLERMKDVLNQGTTLIFVSHDMAAVEAMCQRTVWLDDGVIRSDGPTADTLGRYRVGLEEKAALLARLLDDPVRMTQLSATSIDEALPETGRPLLLGLTLASEMSGPVDLCVGVSEGPATPIFTLTRSVDLRVGENDLRCTIENLPLPKGRYYVWLGAFGPGGSTQMPWHPAAPLDVEGPPRHPPPRGVMQLSPVHVTARWDARGSESTSFQREPTDGTAAALLSPR